MDFETRDLLCKYQFEMNKSAANPTAEMISLLSRMRIHASTAPTLESLQQSIVETIAQNLPYCNWTGFYMLDPDDNQTLILGPYNGTPTPHVRIPLTEGICGAAAASRRNGHRRRRQRRPPLSLLLHPNQIRNRSPHLRPRQGHRRNRHRQPHPSRLHPSRPQLS